MISVASAGPDLTLISTVILAIVALLTMVGTIILFIGRKSWHIFVAFYRFIMAWEGEPAKNGNPAVPGVLQRLSSVEKGMGEIARETNANGGSSMKDQLTQVVETVNKMARKQEKQDERMDLIEKSIGKVANAGSP